MDDRAKKIRIGPNDEYKYFIRMKIGRRQKDQRDGKKKINNK